jgi:hypothetical protein
MAAAPITAGAVHAGVETVAAATVEKQLSTVSPSIELNVVSTVVPLVHTLNATAGIEVWQATPETVVVPAQVAAIVVVTGDTVVKQPVVGVPEAPATQAAADAVAGPFAAHTLLAFGEKPAGQAVLPA